MSKNIDIICPLYNAESYIENLNKSLIKQKKVKINKINYLLTESSDDSKKILKLNKLDYKIIKKEDFSHSLTREETALKSNSDILVFITQDVVIEDENWLYELTKDIDDKEIVACYSRQITKYNNIEKYTRELNYPDYDIIKSKDSIKELGLKTFFFSDASSAISTKIYKELNGYDHKNFMFNEDMYIAHKIINAGYKIKYCSKSIVYHSHNLTLKQTYNRYKDSGKFFKQNPYMNNYGTHSSGMGLAKYIIKRAFQDKNIKVILNWLPDMIARYLGMKAGER